MIYHGGIFMNCKKYFLGIDGGGSKTTAVIFDESGCFVARACGESINYYSVGMEKARENMLAIMNSLPALETECAFIGMSALNERADRQATDEFCQGIIESKNTVMDSDLFIALEAVDAQGEAAVVISGTGSMALHRDKNGAVRHAGGWGYILGDEGSGYSLGLNAVKAAIRLAEKGETSPLTRRCFEYFNIDNIYDLIDLYYNTGVSRKTTAAFARELCCCAAEGDSTSLEIIKNEADLLFETLETLLKKAEPDCEIGLWGGVFVNNEIFRNRFTDSVIKSGFNKVKLLSFTPEQGAVMAALKASGIDITEDIKKNISDTYKF